MLPPKVGPPSVRPTAGQTSSAAQRIEQWQSDFPPELAREAGLPNLNWVPLAKALAANQDTRSYTEVQKLLGSLGEKEFEAFTYELHQNAWLGDSFSGNVYEYLQFRSREVGGDNWRRGAVLGALRDLETYFGPESERRLLPPLTELLQSS